MKRTLSLCGVLVFFGCSSDSTPAADLASGDRANPADVTLSEASARDGAAKDQPQTVGDHALGDLLRTEGGVADHGKPGDQSGKDKGPAGDGPASCGKIRCDCYAFSTKQQKWIPLWGKASQVAVFPDFKVKVVNALGALKVKQVTVLPLKCGDWQSASLAPDFSYQIVTLGEDFTIQYDQIFPGINSVTCPSCK